MDLKQQILHYYRVDEMSLREIARRIGADRKTVTRLIDAYEAAIKSEPDMGIDEFLATRPKYTSRKYAPRVMRDAVAKEIERCLKENDRRRGNGMRKQCLKNTDIHRQLMEKGLTVSYSGVCKYVRKKKNERSSKGKDVYLRIHREPGIECEFDWGEVKLFLDVVPTTLMMAVFCFPYSKGRMAYLFHRQDTLAYMESHRDFFRDCAGVPQVMVYDNMRVAVVFDDKEGAELLFNMISTRTGDKSTIITTNLPFTRWEEIIKDKVLCSALVDRLCHKAFMVNMTGPSYRVITFETAFRWPLFQIHFGGNLLYYLESCNSMMLAAFCFAVVVLPHHLGPSMLTAPKASR